MTAAEKEMAARRLMVGTDDGFFMVRRGLEKLRILRSVLKSDATQSWEFDSFCLLVVEEIIDEIYGGLKDIKDAFKDVDTEGGLRLEESGWWRELEVSDDDREEIESAVMKMFEGGKDEKGGTDDE